MQNKISFTTKKNNRGEWISGIFDANAFYGNKYRDMGGGRIETTTFYFILDDELRSTGVKDVGGTEIWEHDIVEHEEFIGKVKWNTHLTGWCIDDGQVEWPGGLLKECKVKKINIMGDEK